MDEEITNTNNFQETPQTNSGNLAPVPEQNREISTVLPKHDTNIIDLIQQQEKELMTSEDVQRLGKKFGEERIKSDLSAEASRIRRKNIETAENEFENETRELRLKHLKAEMQREHAYNMSTLERDAKHKQMLDIRKKMVEKYGYLYSNENMTKSYDSQGNEYLVPKDFSYSNFVNRLRQFGRNLSKLDKPILQTIKWVLIAGVIAGGIFLLKRLNIM